MEIWNKPIYSASKTHIATRFTTGKPAAQRFVYGHGYTILWIRVTFWLVIPPLVIAAFSAGSWLPSTLFVREYRHVSRNASVGTSLQNCYHSRWERFLVGIQQVATAGVCQRSIQGSEVNSEVRGKFRREHQQGRILGGGGSLGLWPPKALRVPIIWPLMKNLVSPSPPSSST